MSLKNMQYQFAGHIRNPQEIAPPAGLEDRRMAIYRDLFFNNIQGFIANNFPVLRKLYDTDRWLALVRDFYVRHRAHTPLFPELPREFLQFVQAHRGPAAGDPPFISELTHYEWAELALLQDENEIDQVEVSADGHLLDGHPVLSPVAWLLTYAYPVHRIRPDFQPPSPPPEPTHIMLYRGTDDRIHFMLINAVTARMVAMLQADGDLTGRECLARLAAEMQRPLAQIEPHGRTALEQLRTREIILGTTPEHASTP